MVGLCDGSNTLAEQPREESARSGAAHAVIHHAGLPDRSPPHSRGVRSSTPALRTGGGCPVPGPTSRPINARLGASLLHAFLAKATWKAGEAGWVDDAEGRGGELDEVPWPQVTASS